MSAAVTAAVRARLAAAFPAAADVTDEPEPVGRKRLPAYGVRVRRLTSDIVTMGPGGEREDTLDISVAFYRDGAATGFWAALEADAAAIRDAILADPRDLGDLLLHLSPEAEEFDLDTGETRVARVEVLFEARRLAPLNSG